MPSNSPVARRFTAIASWFGRLARTSEDEGQRVRESLLLSSDGDGLPAYEEDDNGADGDDRPPLARSRTNPLVLLCIFIGLGWTIGLYNTYPGPTTVPVFIGLAFMLSSWVVISWAELAWTLLRRRETARKTLSRYTLRQRVVGGLATGVVLWWALISAVPSGRDPPPTMIGNGDKYFIAVNLYNSEAIMSAFIAELTALLFHLGRHDVFVSIYESNSWDGTKTFLHGFDSTLTNLGVGHRIVMVDNEPGKHWPYGTSPERIEFLAKCRNKAMEPIQSADDDVRIPDWQDYTKLIFLNDIRFHWEDIVTLITTKGEASDKEEAEGEARGEPDYDLACAMDYGSSGLYDTWVARDICGTPFRAFWPFAADKPSQQAIRDERPFPVSVCWNGAVVFNAAPFLYTVDNSTSSSAQEASRLSKRGWKMIDDSTYPGARMSPELHHPLKFRTSGIDACDHSECFLSSYDLHRLYAGVEGRPRIYMNPKVKVAYEKNWFHWNTVVLRRPIVQWWRSIWSHRVGYWLFDWPFEHFGRRRDYCTWAGLKIPTEGGRCPPLPGPTERHWDQ